MFRKVFYSFVIIIMLLNNAGGILLSLQQRQAGAEITLPVGDISAQPAGQGVGAELARAETPPQAAFSEDTAYRRVIDLGGGQKQALISTTPINYQAADGSWQPIEVRFEAEAGAFTNRTNSLQVAAGKELAALNLRNGDTYLAWQPQSLVVTGPGGLGEAATLAQPLAAGQASVAALAEDGRTLTYPQSWSLAGLTEEVTAIPGGVEQKLVFASRPQAAAVDEEAYLSLHASLTLMPGAQVYADGQQQTAAFVTQGEVEIRTASGEIGLLLEVPFAYEAADVSQHVQGRYRLTPQEGNGWLVEVQTPWQWWQAAERQYPAVLDPYMTVHHGSEAGSTFEGTISLPDCLLRPDELNNAVVIGRLPGCPTRWRALVRFDNALFPTLPVGATINNAELIVAPTFGYFSENPSNDPSWVPTRNAAAADVVISQVYNDWAWDASTGTVVWNSYTTSTPLDTDTFYVPPPETSTTVMASHYSIPAAVINTWIGGNNYGLELRLEEEDTPSALDNFFEVLNPPTWSGADIDDEPDEWFYPDGGGFLLVLNYTSPELQEGQTYGYDPDYLPPTDNPTVVNFIQHHYGLPSITTPWSAVAVKGISDPGGLGGMQAAGLPALKVSDVTSEATSASSNFIMMRGNMGYYGHELQVLNFAYNGEYIPEATEYIIEARASIQLNGGQPLDAGQTEVHNLTMDSTEILRVFDISLVAGTNVSVKVETAPGSAAVNARLYPPASELTAFGKEDINSQGVAEPLLPVTSGGVWGLVVEYPGDPEEKTGGTFSIPITVTVVACTADELITEQGCWQETKPDQLMTCANVGPFSIRSEEPFLTDIGTGYLYSTSPAVFIDWGTCATLTDDRYVVVTNEVRFYNAAPFVMFGNAVYYNEVYLEYWPAGGANSRLWLWRGNFEGRPNASDVDYGYLVPLYTDTESVALPLEGDDAVAATFKVSVQLSRAEGSVELTRDIETQPQALPGVLETLTVGLDWFIRPDDLLDTAYSQPVTFVSGPTYAEAGVMELYPENTQWEIDYQPGANGHFTLLRTQARIAHTDAMGGKWNNVQMVILPDGQALDGEGSGGNSYTCLGNCMDIRHPLLDDFDTLNRMWEMPDVEINGEANMVAFSQPGSVDIFSTDQPNDTQDVTLPFSFKTFNGEMSLTHGVCPLGTSSEVVPIIHGNTFISLPGLESGGTPGIEAEIWLCEDALRQVYLSYHGIMIPVGATGLFIDSIGGKLTITPQTTEITVEVGYCYSADCALTSGTASLTLNTAGLLSAQIINGTLVGFMNYDGSATITWNPMSFSVNLHGWMDIWILHGDGYLTASVWQGRGWQDQYYWLPDDNATHFAGGYEVTLTIEEGDILSVWWFPDIPWDDWTLMSFSLMIGEFHCGSCSDGYEYGVQGTFSHAAFTLGYDVGVFVGFESGLDIVVAGDQHTLINQYPGSMNLASAGVETVLVGRQLMEIPATAAPDPSAAVFTQELVISANTSSMLVGMGWENLNGQPLLTLIRPDGVEITPENAADYGVNLGTKPYSIGYGVTNPAEGTWQAKISNASSDDYWHLMFLANKRVPDFNLLTPAAAVTWDPNTDGLYPITWDVPAEYASDPNLAVSLHYTKTVSGVVTPTTGLIVDKEPFMGGGYSWDMSYLGEGTYQVWGMLSNGGDGYYHAHPEPLGDDQWMGVSRSLAPGTIAMNDLVGPAAPTGLTLIQLNEALLACWDPNPAPDLAGYILVYNWRDVHGTVINRQQRVAADTPYGSADLQCGRIGGLNDGIYTTVRVLAYDNSGNMSSTASASEWVTDLAPDEGPEVSGFVSDIRTGHSILLSWDHSTAAGYRLYYAVDEPAGPGTPGQGADEGDSPIILGAVGTITLHGLPPGHRIHFVIQAIDADGRLGFLTPDHDFWLTDGADNDDDHVPDDWENGYGLIDPSDDPDRDCLSNAVVIIGPGGIPFIFSGEYKYGTDPTVSDTDGDGFTDGEEVRADSDPMDPASLPEGLLTLARLVVSPTALMFRASTDGTAPPPQYIDMQNAGAGVFTPTVSADVAWLNVSLVDGQVEVTVDPTSLVHGQYSGTITIAGAEGVCTGNAPQTITVILGVFDGSLYQTMIYIPMILKH